MPELVGMGAAYQGIVDSEARWEAKRSNARKAFLEYSNQFPNASYEEYQSYVDSIAGGENYVRGALPSDKVLKNLAAQNQQRYAQQQMEQSLNMMAKRAQISGQIDALLQNQLLVTPDDNKAIENAAAQMGYDAKNPATHSILETVRQNYGGKPAGMMGGGGGVDLSPLRAKLKNDLFAKNMPVLMENLEKYPDMDIPALFKISGINTDGLDISVFKEMADKAKEAVNKKLYDADYEWVIQNKDSLIDPQTGELNHSLITTDNRRKVANTVLAPYAKRVSSEYKTTKQKEIFQSAQTLAATLMAGTNPLRYAANPKEYQNMKAQALAQIQAVYPDATLADVNKVFDPFINIGKAQLEAQTGEQVDAYVTGMRTMASGDQADMNPALLPQPTGPRTPEQARTMMEATRQYRPIIEAGQERTNRTKAAEKARTVLNEVLNPETGLGKQILAGTADDSDVAREYLSVLKRMGIERDEIPEDVFIETMGAEIAKMKDNTALAAAEMAQAGFEASSAAQTEASKKQVGAVMEALSEKDPMMAAIMNGIFNNVVANNRYVPEAAATAFLSVAESLYEQNNGDPAAIRQAILSDKTFMSALESPELQLKETGMVYGNKAGSVEDYLTKEIQGAATDFNDIVSEVSNMMAPIENGEVSPAQALQDISDTIEDIEAAVVAQKQYMRLAQSKSVAWSDTKTPMSDAQLRRAYDEMDAAKEQAIGLLNAYKRRAELAIEMSNIDNSDSVAANKLQNTMNGGPRSSRPGSDVSLGKAGRQPNPSFSISEFLGLGSNSGTPPTRRRNTGVTE